MMKPNKIPLIPILSLLLFFVLLLSGCGIFESPVTTTGTQTEGSTLFDATAETAPDAGTDSVAQTEATPTETLPPETTAPETTAEPTTVLIQHVVTLIYRNGEEPTAVTVEDGKTLPTPPDPQKENCLFDGWYAESGDKYDFSRAVTEDLTLEAHYTIDAVTLTNTISTDTIKSVVKVYNKCYNSNHFITTSSITHQGSGVCFAVRNGTYYILTNCHVAVLDEGYKKQTFSVEDYLGNSYTAYLCQSPTGGNSISPDYDLAVLYFTPSAGSEVKVKELPISAANPEIGEDVISLGSPNGQSNFFTYGKVARYGTVKLSDDTPATSSNVQFEVITHTAQSDHGSSGGPLLNGNLEIVGINYAGAESAPITNSIPAERVIEFLELYVYGTASGEN